jgi:hypothetical protein
MQPKIYDITYYEGDSFTLKVYPKDSNQQRLPLTNVESEDTYFRLAAKRDNLQEWNEWGTSTIQVDAGGKYIQCDLFSVQGEQLKDGYVYDIGYFDDFFDNDDRNKRITVLTGTFRVMSEVKVSGNS